MTYDPLSHTFELYSEDFSLIGTHLIEVQGYLRDYPQVVSSVPNETSSIEIVDPCERPDSITSSA